MDIFKKIATILGVAVIGYFGFYFVCVFYNMIAFLFGGKDSQNTMAILYRNNCNGHLSHKIPPPVMAAFLERIAKCKN